MKNLFRKYLNQILFWSALKSAVIKESIEEVSRRLTIEKLNSLIKEDKVPVCKK